MICRLGPARERERVACERTRRELPFFICVRSAAQLLAEIIKYALQRIVIHFDARLLRHHKPERAVRAAPEIRRVSAGPIREPAV